ncbi:hypothetical protein LCGC14_2187820 [marine sediment metagenome]|uniref:Uncharacterized protein n=1 Tax=marine sediment metagenome TaxID=412755 RepID=A0A0F9DKC8_9ZZZZ
MASRIGDYGGGVGGIRRAIMGSLYCRCPNAFWEKTMRGTTVFLVQVCPDCGKRGDEVLKRLQAKAESEGKATTDCPVCNVGGVHNP